MKRSAQIARKGRFLYFLLTLAFLIDPSICMPSYLVELMNGNQIVIYAYWEDSGQIRFYSHGGVVGVEKGLVREIKEANLACIIEELKPPRRWNDHVETRNKSSSEHEEQRPIADSGDGDLLEEKRRVMLRFSVVSAAFKEAKAKNNWKQMQEERKKLLLSQAELSRLLKKVRNVHGGQVPAWWYEPLPTD